MGGILSIFGRLRKKKDVRVLLIGLDNAGKTTVLKQIGIQNLYSENQKKEDRKKKEKDGVEETDLTNTIPTVGFNVKEVRFKNVDFLVWDLGGQPSIRGLWQHYYRGASGIIYVIDSSAFGRMNENQEQLKTTLSNAELAGVPLLILANKNDVEGALKTEQIIQQLDLEQLVGESRQWFVQSCCALTGDGLLKGLNWFVNELQKK